MDSTMETNKHRKRVEELMMLLNAVIELNSQMHDYSKTRSPEKEIFDVYTEKLKTCEYGSDEYKQYLKEMKPALEHHYHANRHHPEHYSKGISGMDLLDVLEMLCDWQAASERHDSGDIMKSIELNKERFKMSEQLCDILKNTVERFFK